MSLSINISFLLFFIFSNAYYYFNSFTFGILKVHEIEGVINMIRTLIGLLILFWFLGLILDIGGAVIHVLLVIAVIIFIFDLITGRKRE